MKYAIFDLDGTLLDSMWVWENIDLELLKYYGKTLSTELRERVKVLSVRQSCKLFKEVFSIKDSVEDILALASRIGAENYINFVEAKPFVFDALALLKRKNVRMCIATASMRENVIPAMTRLDLLKYFEFIITADDVSTGKDNPEIFNICADRFGAQAKDVFVFEDSLHALITAKNAGFKTIGVYDQTSESMKEKMMEISDHYLNDMSEIKAVL
jgi:HAD superfamily hydrolase (TIGR01549 family)